MSKFKEAQKVRLKGSNYIGVIDRHGFTSGDGTRWDYAVDISKGGMPMFVGMNEDELESI